MARAHGVPVAACYTAYCSQQDMPFWKVKAVRDEFFYGHPCTEMDPKIYDASDFTYCKNAPSMFFQTPLITFLVKQHVDTVIVTGCTTSGCVRATIVDAFSFGFRVQVPEDCCGDAEEGPHKANLADVGRRYADVTTTAEVVKYLDGLSLPALDPACPAAPGKPDMRLQTLDPTCPAAVGMADRALRRRRRGEGPGSTRLPSRQRLSLSWTGKSYT